MARSAVRYNLNSDSYLKWSSSKNISFIQKKYRTIDPSDDLICLRVSSEAKEYFLMWDDQFLLTAIQKIESTGKDVTERPGYRPQSPKLYG